ncbi:MAG: hypothetical protein J3K34DRAFT_413600 [Monoraphidium minutum]|nr:MAG: hypothetical protein J3K34DRAFT_413600 [Monoraphidium minutum]
MDSSSPGNRLSSASESNVMLPRPDTRSTLTLPPKSMLVVMPSRPSSTTGRRTARLPLCGRPGCGASVMLEVMSSSRGSGVSMEARRARMSWRVALVTPTTKLGPEGAAPGAPGGGGARGAGATKAPEAATLRAPIWASGTTRYEAPSVYTARDHSRSRSWTAWAASTRSNSALTAAGSSPPPTTSTLLAPRTVPGSAAPAAPGRGRSSCCGSSRRCSEGAARSRQPAHVMSRNSSRVGAPTVRGRSEAGARWRSVSRRPDRGPTKRVVAAGLRARQQGLPLRVHLCHGRPRGCRCR